MTLKEYLNQGIPSFAVPDKRFIYDVQREYTKVSEVIAAHIGKLIKLTTATIYDYFCHYLLGVDSGRARDDILYTQNIETRRLTHFDTHQASIDNKK